MIISYIKKISNVIFALFVFYLSSYAFCSDSSSKLIEYESFYFNKNKIYRYSDSKFYIVNGKSIYIKKPGFIEKVCSFDVSFSVNGLVVNKKYFVIYGLNNIAVIDRVSKSVLWSDRFEDKIMLRPLIYLDCLYVAFDYDRIVSIDLFSGSLNWQYKNNVTNLHVYVDIKFIQSDAFLFYITSNKMHIINKYTGAFVDRVSIKPRHVNLNLLRDAKIKCMELYNKVLYICYDNGVLLAFDTDLRVFLWQKTFFGFKSFIVYRNHILALRSNGWISLINKADGRIIYNYSNLTGKNFNKIIFFEEGMKLAVLSSNNICIFSFFYNKLIFDKNIFIKLTDAVKSSENSLLLYSKNKRLKEYFF